MQGTIVTAPIFHTKIWTKVLMGDFRAPLEQIQHEKYLLDIGTADQSNLFCPFELQ